MATDITPIKTPGITVVQEIRTPSRVSTLPTLPAGLLAPAYEVVDLLTESGQLNTDALFLDTVGNSYQNFVSRTIAQTDFPGGHVTAPTQGKTNIAAGMVNVLEEEIRAFSSYGSAVKELAEHDVSDNTRVLRGHLVAHNIATRPYVKGQVDLSPGGFNLKDRIIQVLFDTLQGVYPNYIPASSAGLDTTVTFGPGTEVGGTHSAQDIVTQINQYIPGGASLVEETITAVDAAGGSGTPVVGSLVTGGTSGYTGALVRETGGVMYLSGVGDGVFADGETLSFTGGTRVAGTPTNQADTTEKYLALTSIMYGAGARVIVRDSGTANTTIGFHAAGQTGDVYALGAGFRGKDDNDGDFTTPFIELYRGDSRTVGNMEAGTVTEEAGVLTFLPNTLPIAGIDFSRASGSNMRKQDELWADGLRQGVFYDVAPNLITMGEFDVNKAVNKKEFNTPLHPSSPFHPRYVYVEARNLSATAELGASRASITGQSDPWSAELPAYVRTAEVPVLNYVGGFTLKYTATVDGVVQTERVHVIDNPTVQFDDVDDLVLALNTGVGAQGTCSPSGQGLSAYGEIYAEKISYAGKEYVGFKTGLNAGAQKVGSEQYLQIGDGTANVLLDPAGTPNFSEAEKYQGLDVHSLTRTKGDGAYGDMERASYSTVNAVQAPATKTFRIKSILDNNTQQEVVLQADGNFGTAGPYADTPRNVSYNYARELMGLSQTSAGVITIVSVDGTAYPANSRIRDYPSIIRWEFLGADSFIHATGTATLPALGAFSVGSTVRQVTTGAEALVIADLAPGSPHSWVGLITVPGWDTAAMDVYPTDGPIDAAGGTGTPDYGILVSGGASLATGKFQSEGGGQLVLYDITGVFTAGETLTFAGTSPGTRVAGTPVNQLVRNGAWTFAARLAVQNKQAGASNKLRLERGDGTGTQDLDDSIGFAAGSATLEVRGTGIRDTSSFLFHLDRNPALLSAIATEKNVQWGNRTGVSPVNIDDIVAALNASSQQATATIEGTGGSSAIKLTSTKYGMPSEVKIPSLGNSGYVESFDPLGITNAEMGQEFDAVAALADYRSGEGGLSVGQGRPLPDFAVVGSDPASVFIGNQIIRNTVTGLPVGAVSGNLYLQWRGHRLDVTALYKNNGMKVLEYDDEDILKDELGPHLGTKNPLGLAFRIALNTVGEGVIVRGTGVSEVSTAEPFGTQDGYDDALEFMEATTAYGLAPVTLDTRIHDKVHTHITKMSLPDAKKERVMYCASAYPTYNVPTIMGGGTDGNYTGTPGQIQIEDNIIPALQAAGGVAAPAAIGYGDHVYLELSGDTRRWQILSAGIAGQGNILGLRTTFLSTENLDSFYTTETLPVITKSADWSVYVRGAALITGDDRADAIARQGMHFGDRRVRHLVLNEMFVDFGSEESISPAYMAVVYAALRSTVPPQQGLTNYELPAFITAVKGTSDSFTDTQIETIQGGGNNVIVQPEAGGDIYSNLQLTTDVTSEETQEDSITVILDFVSYYLRASIKPLLGKSNLTNSFLDSLRMLIDGMLAFLVDKNVILSGELVDLDRDPNSKRGVIAEIVLEVPFPVNYIKITLAI